MRTAITPTRAEHFSDWYHAAVLELAQHGDVAGSQVIKPYGFAVWERVQQYLDAEFKRTGHHNFYAPLLMNISALEQEAKHMDFAQECAVVTHSRLVKDPDGNLVPDRPLTNPVIIRPTSEAIIGPIVKGWIQSHRDLPMKLNQWANVVRWEMRTRLFLRSSEFLWQEGHTFHAAKEEAEQHAKEMLAVYEDIFVDVLAFSPLVGEKPEYERFAGADQTHTLELLMQDGRALQGGTSHNLGQNFSKAYEVQYSDQTGQLTHTFGTSFGVTTRLIGALVMTHGDDDGLRLPPKIAPHQVVILPINAHQSEAVLEKCQAVADQLSQMQYAGAPVRVHVDTRDMRGGEKSWDWIKKGVPIRIEIGPRDLEQDVMMVMARHQAHKQKTKVSSLEVASVVTMIDSVHKALYDSAQKKREEDTHQYENAKEVIDHFNSSSGFVVVPYLDGKGSEAQLKPHGLSVRCLRPCSQAKCVFTGENTLTLAVIAKAY